MSRRGKVRRPDKHVSEKKLGKEDREHFGGPVFQDYWSCTKGRDNKL